MAKKRWADLSPTGRVVIAALATVQIALAGWAWTDLARRPDSAVVGDRRRWAMRIGLNFIGPVWYFRRGRR